MTLSSDSTNAQPLAQVKDPWVGLDIGGANLKAAHTSGWSKSVSFAMWREWQTLAVSIAKLLEECPAFVGVAVTMTGELADCFATRAEGVAIILEQLTSILPAQMVRIYCVDGTWKSVSQSARDPWSVAASNWHGLARFAVRLVGAKSCLLIDTGSTTTDLIPIRNGQIQLEAKTDSQRLQAGALVYTGIERSNVAAILSEVTLFGVSCPIMNEQFATMRDVYLWLGEMQDEPDCCETADNKPATRESARYRLARIVGEDGSTLADSDIDQLAQQIARAQMQLVAKAFLKLTATSMKKVSTRTKKKTETEPVLANRVVQAFECVAISGHGDFLIESALAACGWDGERIRLQDTLGNELSRCAPAYAIAVLASEESSECPT
jgi:(4-(4-[2-(gamma-L-glutamylamino)ethyl]phenoxymethyl)furan-2-yl)methanamine synthase